MSGTLDMTKGKIVSQLLIVAMPLIICDFIQQLYNTIDAFILARFTSAINFAALGIAETYVNLFTFIVIGICVGSSVILSAQFGAKRLDYFRQEMFISLSFGLAVTLLLSLVGYVSLTPSLVLLNTPDTLIPLTVSYMQIFLLGLIFTFLYNYGVSVLRSVGNTKTSALILFISLILKCGFSYFFIVYFKLGITGAAYGTICTQATACLLFYLYIKSALPQLLFTKIDMVWNKVLVKQTISYGTMTALQQSSLYLGKILIQNAINGLGTAVIASFAAATRLESFINILGNSGAAAISVFVAQNSGAHQEKRAFQGFFKGSLMLCVFGSALAGLLYVGATDGLTFFLGKDGPGLAEGVRYLHAICPFYVLCYMGSSFVGLFRGFGFINVVFWGTTLQISSRVILSNIYAQQYGLTAIGYITALGWLLIVTYQLTVYYKTFKSTKDKTMNQAII